jgi:hypothetical protein
MIKVLTWKKNSRILRVMTKAGKGESSSSQSQQDIPRGTAARLDKFLFSEGSEHSPLTSHTAILGRLVIWRLEEAEVSAELQQAYAREQEGLRDILPAGVTPAQYLSLVNGLLHQCMLGTLDETTADAVPDSASMMQLGPTVYASYKIEAIGWAAAFGEPFLEQVRAL